MIWAGKPLFLKVGFGSGSIYFIELALVMALKFYASVAKGLKLKFRKCLGANSCVCRGYRGRTGREGGGRFGSLHPE